MKKYLKLLSLFLLGFILTACADNGAGSDAGSDEGPMRIGLLIPSEGDYSFNDAAAKGMHDAKAQFGDDIYLRIFEYGNNPEGSFLQATETGFDVLVGPEEIRELLQDFAPEYPDTHFWIYDTEFDFSSGKYDNVSAIYYETNESTYLAGYLAAKTSDTGTIGFIGGVNNPSTSNSLVGYIEGAKAADPEIAILSEFVGSWEDPARARELAKRMYNDEASIIHAVAGGSGIGVIEEAVAQDSQVIGSDLDQAAVFAARGQTLYADVIPTSTLKKIDNSIVRGIEREFEGVVRYGETVSFGLAENFVGLADNEYFKRAYDDDVRNEVLDVRDQIIKEEITVSSYYDMSEAEFEELKTSVQP